jgi:hypothetical protein
LADTIDIIQYNNIRYALSIHPSIPCPPRRPSTTLGASISQTKTATESVSSLRSTPSVLPGSTSTSTHGCWMMDDGPPPPAQSPQPPQPDDLPGAPALPSLPPSALVSEREGEEQQGPLDQHGYHVRPRPHTQAPKDPRIQGWAGSGPRSQGSWGSQSWVGRCRYCSTGGRARCALLSF